MLRVTNDSGPIATYPLYNWPTPMTPARFACGLALLAVISVLGIFFFPVLQGPYPAVHGPVTALLSIRAAARVRLIIVRAGLNAIRGSLSRLGVMLKAISCAPFVASDSDVHRVSAGSCTILRC